MPSLLGNTSAANESKNAQSAPAAPAASSNLFTGFGTPAKPAEVTSDKDKGKESSAAPKESKMFSLYVYLFFCGIITSMFRQPLWWLRRIAQEA
jgi:hypothetical protein